MTLSPSVRDVSSCMWTMPLVFFRYTGQKLMCKLSLSNWTVHPWVLRLSLLGDEFNLEGHVLTPVTGYWCFIATVLFGLKVAFFRLLVFVSLAQLIYYSPRVCWMWTRQCFTRHWQCGGQQGVVITVRVLAAVVPVDNRDAQWGGAARWQQSSWAGSMT